MCGYFDGLRFFLKVSCCFKVAVGIMGRDLGTRGSSRFCDDTQKNDSLCYKGLEVGSTSEGDFQIF